MKLDDLRSAYYGLLPVPKRKPRPVQDERDMENLLEEMFNALEAAERAFKSRGGSYEYECAKDDFERSVGAVDGHIRKAIEASPLERSERETYYGLKSIVLS